VSFQQLYYTSCEHGLGGYGGYQFNAVTPGVSPAVLRGVEEQTVYEPPSWQAGEALEEPEAYPVAFSCRISEATGAVITANVVFAGTDYSGRPGNYFAHALVTSAPERDFGPVLPAELWGAPLWRSSPVAGTELPELAGPPAPGIIDRPGVQSFLLAREAEGILPELLSAVGRAIAGDRPVLIVTEDVTETAWWVAAVSYLLGEPLARRMTFTTYSHRPDYARYHLTGALPGMLLPEAYTSFQIFDFAAGRTPGAAVHPLAAILASAGVTNSPRLWQQAAAFASGAEEGLDDWLAPVALAAGLLGGHLTADQADTVARWLPGATRWIPTRLADVGLGVVLTEPERTLTDERLAELLELARRLPAPPRVEHLERLLALRAIAHIARDEPAVPVALGSPAVSAARNVAIQALERATAPQAVALVTWTGASGITLPEDRLRHYGRTRLEPDVPPSVLAGAVRCHPAVRRGFLERLAGEPPETTRALLSGPVGSQLSRADLGRHPELTELWLLESVARGERPPLRAFDEIVDLRDAARLAPRLDATLLHLLWPRGCPPEDLTELLGVLTDSPPPDVIGWFGLQLEPLPVRATASDQWLGLAAALALHPITGLLPARPAGRVRSAIRILPLLRRARVEGPRGNADAFTRLFEEYAMADDDDIRGLLERELPAVLAGARPLGEALRGCPDDVAAAFCQALRHWLAPSRADIPLAREVFMVSGHPEAQAKPALSERLTAAFEQVRQWSRADLHALAGSMDGDQELARSFQRWRKSGRGEWPRRLLGGAGPSAPGT